MKSTRIEDAPRLRPMKGIEMTILGSGDNITLVRTVIQPRAVVPEHSHPNEQMGTCLAGEGRLTSGGITVRVKQGTSWTIPANEPHSFVAERDQPVTMYEMWSPPREDYLSMPNER